MKKLSYFLTAACALMVFSSCEDKKDPVYHAPTAGSFSLYTPAMQDQYIVLKDGNTLELVTSGQPDYGFSGVATYGVQLSMTSDFSDPEKVYDLTPIDAHQSKIALSQFDVAFGVCALLGLDNLDAFQAMFPNQEMPYMPLYFKANCQLAGVNGSYIESNVVSYNYIKPYFAVASPDYIYIVGTPSGWTDPVPGNAEFYANWRLWEPDNAIGSKIYSATFDLAAAPMFRFYTELGDWNSNSYGTQVDDNPIEFPEFTGADSWTHALVAGKGSFSFPNFPGGEVTIIVDMSVPDNMTVSIQAGAVDLFVPKYIYMIGNFTADGGWKTPDESNKAYYENYRLFNSASAEGVYTGSIDIPAADYDLYVRFAYELLGWDDGQWGYQVDDQSTLFDLTDNSFSSSYVKGKGAWEFVLPEPGRMDIAVDTDNETVTFNFVPSGE